MDTRKTLYPILCFFKYNRMKTLGQVAYFRYKEAKGSQRYHVTLRYYLLPKGIKPNGEVLYMTTPLNRQGIFALAQGKSVVKGVPG